MNCKNCNTSLSKLINYCPLCGAKIVKKRLTLKNLFVDFSEQFLNIDNKFLKTFIHLFTKPDIVIVGFIKGTRKKYINVIQYLAISLTLLGIQLFILNKISPDFFESVLSDSQGYFAMYPEDKRVEMEKFMASYYTFINEYQSFIYVIGIPFTALATWLTFIKEKLFNFTEHIVINTYITAQYVIFSFLTNLFFAILNLNITVLVTLSTLLYMFYYGFVFYKTHKLGVVTIFLRFLLSLAIICSIFLLLFIIGAIVGIVFIKFFK